MEIFAGIGSLTQCLRAAELNAGQIEIKNWVPWQAGRAARGLPVARGNPLDLRTASGFACLCWL